MQQKDIGNNSLVIIAFLVSSAAVCYLSVVSELNITSVEQVTKAYDKQVQPDAEELFDFDSVDVTLVQWLWNATQRFFVLEKE
ncbi:MAG: hypothetical protein AAF738_10535 [Bacteroidota bacterium]